MITVSITNKKRVTETGKQGAIVTTAVTASFSWDGFYANASWLTIGTWYGSIILSLLSVNVAFQHSLMFTSFSIHPDGPRGVLEVICRDGLEHEPDMAFIFSLQVPGMLLSLSLISYFMGLSLLIIFPLWEGEWGAEMKVSCF